MADIKLLIVEDEDSQIDLYRDAIDEYNAESNNNIQIIVEKNAHESIQHLKSSEFDAAIVDLNLEHDSAEGASGNDVLREIKQSHRFPILVVTGTPHRLEPDIERNIFLEVFERTSIDTMDLLRRIDSIYQTGITRILGARGKLEDLIQKIFWNHISNGFEYWLGKDSESALLRYSINHLTEYLDLPETGSLVQFYYEPEYYITPPIKEDMATGDIVEKDGERYIVMNPACDLVPRRVEGDNKKVRDTKEITLVKILELDEAELKKEGYIEEGKTLNKDKIRSFVSNYKNQFAFLPDYNNIKRALIDFRKITTIQLADYHQYTRLATIAMPFLKDIQGRFSQYYGRQGQPDLDKDGIIQNIMSENN